MVEKCQCEKALSVKLSNMRLVGDIEAETMANVKAFKRLEMESITLKCLKCGKLYHLQIEKS
jgi:hypothetical protein